MDRTLPPSAARALTGLLVFLSLSWSTAYAQPDYSSELPRVPPLSPQEAPSAFQIADGYRLELVAAEPLVVDPVAVAFDANQSMYVVEMRGYSEDEALHIGRIRYLRDQDGDGLYETSTIFADGFGWPTAVACYDRGIFVASAPDLLYLKDTNGDGVADEKRVVFSGFGRSNVQGLVNTLQWGPDQRIHGVTSSSGAELRASDGDNALSLRGRDFSFDPRSLQLEAVSGGGQHGMSFDDAGNKFVCSNSDHIQQVMYEDRYWNRNPFTVPPPSRVSIAVDGPQADVFRASPVEPWRLVRTRLRVAGVVPGPVEGGGRPAGYFTSATGVTIVRGNAFVNDPMFGMAVVADVGSNLVHRKRLKREAILYRAERVDPQTEFLRSKDIWFRPVQMANGPDGCLYILDMYREVIEHPASLPPEIKRHLDLTSGRDRGRIYRVSPVGYQRPAPISLEDATNASLVAALQHPNAWHQETAARLLYERQATDAVPLLEKVASDHSDTASWRALRVLESLGKLTADQLHRALRHPSASTRRHAIALSERYAADSQELRTALLECADDEDASVRYQLAFTLGQLPGDRAVLEAFSQLAVRDMKDGYVLAAIQSSLKQDVGGLLIRCAKDPRFLETHSGRDFLRGLANQLARQHTDANEAFQGEWAAWQTFVTEHDSAQETAQNFGFLATILPELVRTESSPWSRAFRQLENGTFWNRVMSLGRDRVQNVELSADDRQQAIALLALDDWQAAEPIFLELLQPAQPPAIQETALAVLQKRTSRDAAQLVVGLWPELSPAMRTRAVDWLSSFTEGQRVLMESMKNGTLPLAEISAGQRNQLAQVLPPDEWASLQTSGRDAVSEAERNAILERYRAALAEEPNIEQGRQQFRKVCSECHRLESTGYEIGPNLVTLQNRGAETILLNVLEPNREVNPQYINYVATTIDGRVASGMIQGETATSITLLRAGNQSDVILRRDLESLRSTSASLMPSGLDQQISPEVMRDLIGYILSLK